MVRFLRSETVPWLRQVLYVERLKERRGEDKEDRRRGGNMGTTKKVVKSGSPAVAALSGQN